MSKLAGKVAVVTGGAGPGIGHGISVVLAAEGAQVVIVEIDLDKAKAVQGLIENKGGRASVLRADISKAAEVRTAMERVVAQYQRLDVLVNSAGVGLVRPLAEASEEEFDRLASIDLRGLWLCCKYAIRHMQRQKAGSIVNIASVHSRATMPQFSLYAAMKSGVAGLTRGIAVDYGPDGIRANTVCPGLVEGAQTREIVALLSTDVDQWMRDFVRRHQALPRVIQPEDIGHLVAFLASDESKAITGAEIPVDAGLWVQAVSRD